MKPNPNCNYSFNTKLHASEIDLARIILVVLIFIYLAVNLRLVLRYI
jgi:hypothetical protein